MIISQRALDVRLSRAGLAVILRGRKESNHPEAADVRTAAAVPLPPRAGKWRKSSFHCTDVKLTIRLGFVKRAPCLPDVSMRYYLV